MQISSKFHRKTSDKNRQNKYSKEMCSIYLSSSFLLFLPSFPSKLLVDATEHLQVHSRNIISDQLSLPPVTLTCRLTAGFGECVLVVSGSDDGGRLLSSEWIVLHQWIYNWIILQHLPHQMKKPRIVLIVLERSKPHQPIKTIMIGRYQTWLSL